MQLTFDNKAKRINIKDEVPMQSKIVLLLMSINTLNLGFQLYSIPFKTNKVLFSFLIIITLVSLALVMFYVLKKSWKSTYLLSEIAGITSKSFLGNKRMALKLMNGKTRSFQALKNEKELENLKQTLTSFGIRIL